MSALLDAMKEVYGDADGERLHAIAADAELGLRGKSIVVLDTMAEQIASLGTEAKRLVERMDEWKVHPSRGSQDERLGQDMSSQGWSESRVKEFCINEGWGPSRCASVLRGWKEQEARG